MTVYVVSQAYDDTYHVGTHVVAICADMATVIRLYPNAVAVVGPDALTGRHIDRIVVWTMAVVVSQSEG